MTANRTRRAPGHTLAVLRSKMQAAGRHRPAPVPVRDHPFKPLLNPRFANAEHTLVDGEMQENGETIRVAARPLMSHYAQLLELKIPIAPYAPRKE